MLKITLLQWIVVTSSCPKGNQSSYGLSRAVCWAVFHGACITKHLCALLTDLRLCENSIYLIYERKMCKAKNLCKLNWSSNQDVVVNYNKSMRVVWCSLQQWANLTVIPGREAKTNHYLLQVSTHTSTWIKIFEQCRKRCILINITL